VAFLSIEKSAIGVANAWEKLKYANSVDVLNAVRIIMIPDTYNDSKTYKHGELCKRWNGQDIIVYRASCTNMAMQGIPPDDKDKTDGSFWISEGPEGDSPDTLAVLASAVPGYGPI
jgi:hypothetical protein